MLAYFPKQLIMAPAFAIGGNVTVGASCTRISCGGLIGDGGMKAETDGGFTFTNNSLGDFCLTNSHVITACPTVIVWNIF